MVITVVYATLRCLQDALMHLGNSRLSELPHMIQHLHFGIANGEGRIFHKDFIQLVLFSQYYDSSILIQLQVL